MIYFAPFGDCIVRRTKEEADDLKSIGLMQTNNSRKMYSIERVYGEMEAVEIPEEWPVLAPPVPARRIARLPVSIESELTKFLCTIGLSCDGSIIWNHAERRRRSAKT